MNNMIIDPTKKTLILSIKHKKENSHLLDGSPFLKVYFKLIKPSSNNHVLKVYLNVPKQDMIIYSFAINITDEIPAVFNFISSCKIYLNIIGSDKSVLSSKIFLKPFILHD